jgi:hypothetical protein
VQEWDKLSLWLEQPYWKWYWKDFRIYYDEVEYTKEWNILLD